MRHSFHLTFLPLAALALVLISCQQAAPPAVAPPPAGPVSAPVQAPRIADATGDWTKQAHQVQVLTSFGGAPAKADMAIGWTPDALLISVHAEDTTPIETDNDELRHGDSLEIFVSSAYGSDDCIRCVASPGGVPGHPAPRSYIFDKRPDAPPHVPLDVKAQRDAKGYVATMAIPWKNFKHVPQPGDIIGVQVMVNDAPRVGLTNLRAWFPVWGCVVDPLLMQRVQLADQCDPPEIAAAQIQPQGFRDLAVTVLGSPESAGKDVAAWSAGKQIASGALAAGGSEGSTLKLVLPRELAAQKDAVVKVTVAGTTLPVDLKVPDMAKYQTDLIHDLPLVANPSVFSSDSFPPIDFLNQEIVAEAIGPYTIHTRFFDANWNEVTTPQAPGRYGALVELKTQSGLTITHQMTLFKTAKPYFMPKDPYTGITLKFPDAFGISPATVTSEQWNINDWVGHTLDKQVKINGAWAVLLASLQDIAKDPARWHGFYIWRVEDAWWNELHKRLGRQQDYTYGTYLPPDYDKDQHAWPLLIALHGGSGSNYGTLKDHADDGPLDYIHSGHPIPFIVVNPLCIEEEYWDPDKLARLIDTVAAKYRVDQHRVYVTGGSMGGYGAWDFAATYPDKIAAVVPVFGGESPGIAARMKSVPVWAFHGAEDPVVYTRYSIDIVRQLNALGNPARLTIYPGYGHGDGSQTGFNPEVYKWLLQQSK